MSLDQEVQEIRAKCLGRKLCLERRALPEAARKSVIGELEESARETNGIESRARMIAADALEGLESPTLFAGVENVVQDVETLLAAVDQIKRGF